MFQKARIGLKLCIIVFAILTQISALLLVSIDVDSSDTKSNYNLYYGDLQQKAVCEDDIDALNSKCTNMFSVSRMILDSNAYAHIYGDNHYVGE